MEEVQPPHFIVPPALTEPRTSLARRALLRWASGVGAGMIALLVGVPSATAFATPGFGKPNIKEWVKLADDVSTPEVGTPVKIDYVEAVNNGWVEARTLRTVRLYTDDGAKFIAYSEGSRGWPARVMLGTRSTVS